MVLECGRDLLGSWWWVVGLVGECAVEVLLGCSTELFSTGLWYWVIVVLDCSTEVSRTKVVITN